MLGVLVAGEEREHAGADRAAARARQRLGDEAAVVLGATSAGKVALVGVLAPAVAGRGPQAADVVRSAAQVVGGGGGGGPEVAQAGGRDPDKLDEALALARKELTEALS